MNTCHLKDILAFRKELQEIKRSLNSLIKRTEVLATKIDRVSKKVDALETELKGK